MKNEQVLKVLEDNNFTCSVYDDEVEAETWTDEGVHMVITLDTSDLLKSFKEYADNFDPETEILNYIHDDLYLKNIGIRYGLFDFDNYQTNIRHIYNQLVNQEKKEMLKNG